MSQIEKSDLHELEILQHVERDPVLTNRVAATKLGVSVKLAHETLKRMVSKGLLHVRKENSRCWHYFLTPQGLAQKAQLTVEFLDFSMQFYRVARRQSAAVCRRLHESGFKRVAFVGCGDLAEIAYLGLNEWQLQLVEVYGDVKVGRFMGLPVRAQNEVGVGQAEAVIICVYDRANPMSGRYLPENVTPDSRMHWIF